MELTFAYVDKSELSELMPRLFEILHDNMDEIAPTGRSYEEDYREWYGNVYPAMQKAPRQMATMRDGERLIGFFQYYVNEGRFVMEEIQLQREMQGRGVFEAFFQWLLPKLPVDVQWVEAYAHRENLKSQGILNHLGLARINSAEPCDFLHYKGDFDVFCKCFLG